MPDEPYTGSVETGLLIAAMGDFGGILLCLGLLAAGMGYPLVGFGITNFYGYSRSGDTIGRKERLKVPGALSWWVASPSSSTQRAGRK
jgi:hypothetical protein